MLKLHSKYIYTLLVVSFYFTKLSTIWLWYHIHVWKRLMCVPGKNILKSSATSVTTLTHMDNRSFLTVLVRGMALQKTLQRPTLVEVLSRPNFNFDQLNRPSRHTQFYLIRFIVYIAMTESRRNNTHNYHKYKYKILVNP